MHQQHLLPARPAGGECLDAHCAAANCNGAGTGAHIIFWLQACVKLCTSKTASAVTRLVPSSGPPPKVPSSRPMRSEPARGLHPRHAGCPLARRRACLHHFTTHEQQPLFSCVRCARRWSWPQYSNYDNVDYVCVGCFDSVYYRVTGVLRLDVYTLPLQQPKRSRTRSSFCRFEI